MSTRLFELRKEIQQHLAKSDAIVSAAEKEHRSLTPAERQDFTHAQQAYQQASSEIKRIESENSIVRMLGPSGELITDSPTAVQGRARRNLGANYPTALLEYCKSGGKNVSADLLEGSDGFGGYKIPDLRPTMSAALEEGIPSSGGYAVPITVSDLIVPLAPTPMAVRKLAQVIPTTMDIKFPQKAAFGTAAAKAELATFGGAPVTLGQITLSAFMAGSQEQASWELLQDVNTFQAFVVDDMILAQQMYEENLYVNGTGTGQAQGLIGNVGSGVTEEPDTNGNLVSIAGTLDLIGTLNPAYYQGAAWLMSVATSIIIRKAQTESNLFFPAFTRGADGVDRLHGYPVEYSGFMPTASRGNAPVLFGNFKRGYIIGDRGGSGINVKVLDQPLAAQGIVVLLAYRRTDGRVLRSEAIQQYTIAAS